MSLTEYSGVSEEGTHDFEIVFSDVSIGRIDLFYRLAERKLPMVQLRPLDMSLEEVFLRVTEEASDIASDETEDIVEMEEENK